MNPYNNNPFQLSTRRQRIKSERDANRLLAREARPIGVIYTPKAIDANRLLGKTEGIY